MGKQLFGKQNRQDLPWVALGMDGWAPPLTGVRNWGRGKPIWAEMIGVPLDDGVGDPAVSKWACLRGHWGEVLVRATSWQLPAGGGNKALVFGRIVQLLDSSGKAKELPGREHWGRRAMKADQPWRWEESQEWALQMHS